MTELTKTELKIVKFVCDEKSNAEIAEKLQYGLRYVEKLKARLYAKAKVTSGIGLLKWALRNKLYKLSKR